MAAQPVTETIRSRITLSPGEPTAFPTFSVWQDPPHTVANAQSVDLPTAADVVIIGSGITGCAVAHTLLRKTPSLSVTVLEARQTASGATGRNGGHLLSDNLFLIPKYVPTIGVEAAGEVAHFSNKNSTRIRDLVQTLSQEERDAVGLREVLATAAFGDVETLEQAKKDLQVLQQIHPESARQYKIIAAEDAIQVSSRRRLSCLWVDVADMILLEI
jgi:glycine/D-amino acid oxidase-like deaminating enzyme